MRTRRACAAVALAALAATARAEAAPPPPGAGLALEAGPLAGVHDEAALGYTLRAHVRGGAVAVGASLEHTLAQGGPRRWDVHLLAAGGVRRSLGERITGYAQLVGGWHAFRIHEGSGDGWDEHVSPAAGVRVGGRLVLRGWPYPTVGASATVLADVRPNRDFFLAREVARVTALLALTVGLGRG